MEDIKNSDTLQVRKNNHTKKKRRNENNHILQSRKINTHKMGEIKITIH